MALKRIQMKSSDIFAFEAIGEVNKSDYVEVLFPILNQARKEGRRIRFLIHFGDKFEGYTKEAIWQDFKLGLKFLRVIERLAIVTDIVWLKNLVSLFGSLIPCSVEVFKSHDLDSAKAWVDSGELALDYSLDEERGVLEVEISAPLSTLNFEVMTNKVDSYLENKGVLNGLLIHVKKFPGWENLGSLITHFEFIKSHHEKIKKVALVTDSQMAEMMPLIAKQFVMADVRNFSYDELKYAQEWITSN